VEKEGAWIDLLSSLINDWYTGLDGCCGGQRIEAELSDDLKAQ
jgi:hypothetical protein